MSLRYGILILLGCWFNQGYTQFNPGLEVDFGFLPNDALKVFYVSDYNENETFTYYKVENRLNPFWTGFSIRNFGGQFNSSNKVAIGYSLGIGFRQCSSTSQLHYQGSSTTNRDSIITRLDGGKFHSTYRILFMNHFFDLHWNVSESIKITNSFGVNLSAIVKYKSKFTNIKYSPLNTDSPLLKLFYQPQITEKYDRCSISYYALIDVFSVQLFNEESLTSKPTATAFSSLRFNAIGLRFMPHLKPPRKIDPNEIF